MFVVDWSWREREGEREREREREWSAVCILTLQNGVKILSKQSKIQIFLNGQYSQILIHITKMYNGTNTHVNKSTCMTMLERFSPF
jgi:hypothetical protein